MCHKEQYFIILFFNTFSATEELSTMKRMIITDANAAAFSNRLKNITADRKFLNKHDVVLALDILEKVVDQRNISGEVRLHIVFVASIFRKIESPSLYLL